MRPRIRRRDLNLPLAIDSGAHGMWGKFFAAKTSEGVKVTGKAAWDGADYSFLHTREFTQYLETYIDFCRNRGKLLEFYVALDVVNNPAESRRVYKQMLTAGVRPLPVYHYGEDESVLEEYLHHTDYVGYTGPHHVGQKDGYVEHSDAIWKKYFLDSKGKPRIKVHGFAMTNFDYMARWPWYSVDSTSAFTQARTGACLYPKTSRYVKEGLDYYASPITMCHTERRGDSARPYARLPQAAQSVIHEHLDRVGVTEEQVAEDYRYRDRVNLYFMNQQIKAINDRWENQFGEKDWLHYYASGNASAGPSTLIPTFQYLSDRGQLDNICYLGTFFTGQRAPMELVMLSLHGVGMSGGGSHGGNKRPSTRPRIV